LGENKDRSLRYLFETKSSDVSTVNSILFREKLQPISTSKQKIVNGLSHKKVEIIRTSVDEMTELNKQSSLNYLGEASPKDQKLQKVVDSLLKDFDANLIDKVSQASVEFMNRNARAPKKANRGRRPCSHVARRSKRLKRHKGW
jgi:hypothetical protein